MKVNIRFVLDENELRSYSQQNGMVYRAIERAAQRVRDLAVREITRLNAIDSGTMRAAMTYEMGLVSGNKVQAVVGPDVGQLEGSVDYPIIVHQGRGPVVPRRAKVLRFQPKGSSSYVFAKRVGPAAAKPFLTNALAQLSIRDIDRPV